MFFPHIGKAVQKQEFMDKINRFFKISSFVFHRIKKVIQVSNDMKASTDPVQIFEWSIPLNMQLQQKKQFI